MTGILEVSGLTKHFGHLAAVHDVTLSVEAGEIKAIIGPNGAGKSTLFNLITGMPATAGRIQFKESEITYLPKYRRARLGLIKADQIVSIFPSLSVLENVALADYAARARAQHIFASPVILAPHCARARAVLERVGLAEAAEQTAGELSHGDKKRLEIAIAIAKEPELLLLDEPTSGLSPHESAVMADLITAIAKGRTVLLIEHDIDIVLALSSTVLVMHRGSVLAQGRPDEIERNPAVQDAYLGGYR